MNRFKLRHNSLLKNSIYLIGLSLVGLLAFNNCAPAKFSADTEISSESPTVTTASPPGSKPSGVLEIENGLLFINRQSVTLALRSDTAKQMFVSNSPDCGGNGSWEDYQSQKTWMLGQTNQLTTVSVIFRNENGDSDCIYSQITHDDMKPVIMNLSKPADFTNVQAAQVSFDVYDSLSGLDKSYCTASSNLTGSGLTQIAVPGEVLCLSGLLVSALVEGPTSVTLIAKDKAGNQSDPVVASWFYDRTAPLLSVSGPAATDGNSTATFNLSAQDANGSGIQYILCGTDINSLTACVNNQRVLSGLTEGPKVFYARAYDRAGNASALATYNWQVDLTAPIITLSGPSTPTNSTTANFVFSGTDGGLPISIFECSLDGAAFSSCVSPRVYTGLTAGNHTFQVRGIDGVGNASAPRTHTWLVDLALPTVTINPSVPLVTTSNAISFTVTAVDAQTSIVLVEYSVDGGAYQAYTGQVTLNSLAVNTTHRIDARARDAAGNVGNAFYQWTIDRVLPVLTINGPSGYTTNRNANITFSATANGGRPVTFTCQLNGSAFVACASPTTFANLIDGTYVYNVIATDSIGNQSTVGNVTWTVDTVAPVVIINSAPVGNISTSALANVNFSVTETNLQSVACTLNGVNRACAVGSNNLGTLSAGNYTYVITALDRAGNTGTASASWTVSAPSPPISFFASNNNINGNFTLTQTLGAFPFNFNYPAGVTLVLVSTFNSAGGSIQVSDSSGNTWAQAITNAPGSAYGFLSGVYYSKLNTAIPNAGTVQVRCVGCSAGTPSGSFTIYAVNGAQGIVDAKAVLAYSSPATNSNTLTLTGQNMTADSEAMIVGVLTQTQSFQVSNMNFLANGATIGTSNGSSNNNTGYRSTAAGLIASGLLGKTPGIQVNFNSSAATGRLIYLVTVK